MAPPSLSKYIPRKRKQAQQPDAQDPVGDGPGVSENTPSPKRQATSGQNVSSIPVPSRRVSGASSIAPSTKGRFLRTNASTRSLRDTYVTSTPGHKIHPPKPQKSTPQLSRQLSNASLKTPGESFQRPSTRQRANEPANTQKLAPIPDTNKDLPLPPPSSSPEHISSSAAASSPPFSLAVCQPPEHISSSAVASSPPVSSAVSQSAESGSDFEPRPGEAEATDVESQMDDISEEDDGSTSEPSVSRLRGTRKPATRRAGMRRGEARGSTASRQARARSSASRGRPNKGRAKRLARLCDDTEPSDEDVAASDHENDDAIQYRDNTLSLAAKYHQLITELRTRGEGRVEDLQAILDNTLAEKARQSQVAGPWQVSRRKKAWLAQNAGDVKHTVSFGRLQFYVQRQVKQKTEEVLITRNLGEFPNANLEDDAHQVEELAENFVKVLNVWPLNQSPSKPRCRVIMRAAISLCHGMAFTFRGCFWSDEQGLRVELEHVSPKGEIMSYRYTTKRGFRWHGVPWRMPSTARYVDRNLSTPMRRLEDGTMTCIPADFDPATSPMWKAEQAPTIEELIERERFMNMLSCELQGIVATHEEMPQILSHYEYAFGGAEASQTRAKASLGGVFTFSRSGRYLRIYCGSKNHQERLGLTNRHVATLGVVDGRWVARLIDLMTGTEQESLLVIFERLIAAIDDIHESIAAGEEPPNVCGCSHEERSTEHHACNLCLRQTRCIDLTTSSQGQSLCPVCQAEHAEHLLSVHKQYISDKLRDRLKRDTWFGVSDERLEEMVSQCTESILAQQADCPHGQWRCYYTGLSSTPAIYSAFVASVEALVPFGRWDDDTVTNHYPGGIGLAKLWLNYAHGGFHIAILQEAAEWQRSDKGPAASLRLRERMDRIRRVTKTWERCRRQRTTSMSEVDYQETLRAWQTLALPEDEEDYYKYYEDRFASQWCPWSAPNKRDLCKLMQDICGHFGVADILDSVGNERHAPWFISLGTRPPDWDWDNLYAFFYSRLCRMRYDCNYKWVKAKKKKFRESAATLLLELCWQLCAKKAKNPQHKSLFDMPMDIRLASPISVSYGHAR